MAEFKKVAQEKMRICKQFSCDKCPLGKHNTTHFGTCSQWAMAHPEEAERIIMQWAAEHPMITNRDKFKEVFGLDYLDPLPGGGSAWLTAEYKGGQDVQN